MLKNMSKGKRILLYLSIILASMSTMCDMVIFPITYNLYQEFPNNTEGVNFILSGPAIFMMIASLLAPFIIKRIGKRNALLSGFTLFTTGSVLGILVETIPYMIFMRSLVGFGSSIVCVTCMTIIPSIFTEDKARNNFLGLYNACMSLIGSAMSYASGMLATLDWRYAFKVYYIAIPVLVMIFLFVPQLEQSSEDEAETKQVKAAHSKKKDKFGPEYVGLVSLFVLFTFCYVVVSYYISVFIIEKHIGSEVLAGTVNSLVTLGCLISSVMYGFVSNRIGRRTASIGYGATLLCFIFIVFVPNQITIVAAGLLIGIAYGTLFTYMMGQIPVIVPESRIADAIGIASASGTAPSFFATHIVTFLMANVFLTKSIVPIFRVPLVIIAIVFVVDFILSIMDYRKSN